VSGPHVFAVRLKYPRQEHHPRPPHPSPASVTLRNAPSVGTGRWEYTGDLRLRKNRIFFQKGLDTSRKRSSSDLPVGRASRPIEARRNDLQLPTTWRVIQISFFVQPAFASRFKSLGARNHIDANELSSRALRFRLIARWDPTKKAAATDDAEKRRRETMRNNPAVRARDIWRCGARRSSVGHGTVGGTLWQTAASRTAVHANVLARIATIRRDRAFHPVIAFKSIMTGELHASS
jgi:hypothetical protein